MKRCLYIHQDYQPPKLSQYPLDKISFEQAHFPQVLCAKCYYKSMNVFYATFQLTTSVGQLMIFMAHALIYK